MTLPSVTAITASNGSEVSQMKFEKLARRSASITTALIIAATLTAGFTGQAAPALAQARGTAPSLHVSGNRLVNARGQRVVLRGVNRSGGEYQCIHGVGFWDVPMDQASLTAMKGWDIKAVRVPLNEACWNGQKDVPKKYRGAPYQKAVQAYVRLLNANGMVAILDLHWSDGLYLGPGSTCASPGAFCEKPMPDAAQSVPFWASVARTFKGNGSVIFDLFNQPFPNEAPKATAAEAWHCWLHGGRCTGIGYKIAGMQQLVSVVRGTGARNVIMLGGLSFSNDLTRWLRNKPADPAHNLAASWDSFNFDKCSRQACWNSQIAPVIARVPVIVGLLGENDCADKYINPLMRWLDVNVTGYLAWAWNADFNCATGPGLITDYSGTPTAYGKGYQAHLRSLG